MNEQVLCASAFIYHDGKVLAVRRSDHETSFAGYYEIPGGHIEIGESYEAGLQREVKEETGLDVTVLHPYFAFTYLSPNSGRHIGEVHFLAELTDSAQAVLLNPDEHSEYQWIEASQIDSLNFTEVLRQSVAQGFEILSKTV